MVRALAKVGCEATVSNAPEKVVEADAVIFPGVGAAGDAVRTIKSLRLDEAIDRVIAQGRPFLGLCLGLQVLFETTEEGGMQSCLGIIPGVVRKLPPGQKVPHMGWNSVHAKKEHPIFDGIPDDSPFYFVHSYYAEPRDPNLVIGETEYGLLTFCSAIARGSLVATQFHPEKSGALGLKIYENFLRYAFGDNSRH
ncbi:MAG: hisH [Dehalococcoidia bacterium]|nr:hisH [Dehalococcoidia bacterium]